MKALCMLIGFVALGSAVHAEVAPLAVHAPQAKAWVGQRVALFVDLRSRGSFAGTASFDLPRIPGTLLMKIGAPVVGSQELDGETWFVQTHELALFSQKPGLLEVPPFAVRFARREDFTGPATDVEAQVPGWEVEIQRPPGSEHIGFLITTESLDISETWAPQPGAAAVGDLFKRTIVQRATQLSGMALAPAPVGAPDGVRVYPGEAETNDKLERGEFLGERRETITYLLQEPGAITLPALTYVWWNPSTEELASTTLPAVTFAVAASADGSEATASTRAWAWLLAAIVVAGLGASQWRRLGRLAGELRETMNPADRVAARMLLRACRRDDAAAAESAWLAWRNTPAGAIQLAPELHAAVLGLQRHLFGPAPAGSWKGDDLARAFRAHLVATRARSARERASSLPGLNSPAP